MDNKIINFPKDRTKIPNFHLSHYEQSAHALYCAQTALAQLRLLGDVDGLQKIADQADELIGAIIDQNQQTPIRPTITTRRQTSQTSTSRNRQAIVTILANKIKNRGTPRQGRPAAATRVAPHRRPCDSTNSREIYKRGDEIILGVKDKFGNTKNWRGFLGDQNMMTGQWYVMTADWSGYASEKSFRPAT